MNLVDNYSEDPISDSEEEEIPETDLAVNVTELILADHHKHSSIEDWYIDSGATKHVTGRQRESLSKLGPGNRSKVTTARGETLHVEGNGNVDIFMDSGKIKFENVLYVSGITKNLLSVGPITDSQPNRMVLFV